MKTLITNIDLSYFERLKYSKNKKHKKAIRINPLPHILKIALRSAGGHKAGYVRWNSYVHCVLSNEKCCRLLQTCTPCEQLPRQHISISMMFC